MLRHIALASTPTSADLEHRLAAMGRLKTLAQSGIRFCVGLDLEPYGSFVSGLYTPEGDLDLSIEGVATWCARKGGGGTGQRARCTRVRCASVGGPP